MVSKVRQEYVSCSSSLPSFFPFILLPFHPSSHFCVAMMCLHMLYTWIENIYRLEQSNVTLKSFEIAQLINLTPSNDMVSLPTWPLCIWLYFTGGLHACRSPSMDWILFSGRSGVCERNDSLPCAIYRAPTTRLFGCASTASISVLHVELIWALNVGPLEMLDWWFQISATPAFTEMLKWSYGWNLLEVR